MAESWRKTEFYRYVSEKEAQAIEETGMLRGGRGAGTQETFWTEERYESADEARARLALRRPPEVRVRFTIRNEPDVRRRGGRVDPDHGQPGGGTECSSYDAVVVDLPLLEKEELA